MAVFVTTTSGATAASSRRAGAKRARAGGRRRGRARGSGPRVARGIGLPRCPAGNRRDVRRHPGLGERRRQVALGGHHHLDVGRPEAVHPRRLLEQAPLGSAVEAGDVGDEEHPQPDHLRTLPARDTTVSRPAEPGGTSARRLTRWPWIDDWGSPGPASGAVRSATATRPPPPRRLPSSRDWVHGALAARRRR